MLRAGEPGRYRLLVEMIGYESTYFPFFDLAAGQTIEQTLTVSIQPLSLEGITVRVEQRCATLADASADVYRLWTEARKALTAVSLTEDAPFVFFLLRLSQREIDPETGVVLSENVRPLRVSGNYPFRSPPAEELMRRGFVRAEADTTFYYAPDAHVLLSDAFLAGHCFRAVPGDSGLVGLAFEPVPARDGLSETEGVLWLDSETAALRWLEFRYVDLRAGLPGDVSWGGRLEFEELDSGAWIVRRWAIRMPRPVIAAETGARVAIRIRESSGEVVESRGPGTVRRFAAPRGALRGRLTSGDPDRRRTRLPVRHDVRDDDGCGRCVSADRRPGGALSARLVPSEAGSAPRWSNCGTWRSRRVPNPSR
ncbi:MAG TPA: carboxypeptidase-like regulatory domain-containing protein [Longimicrobiales bacterium]